MGQLAQSVRSCDSRGPDSAESVYQGRLSASPNDPEALYALADIYARQGRTIDAIGLLKRLVLVDENQGLAWFGLGLLLASLGHRDDAARCFERTAQIHPELAEPRFNLGVLLVLQERWREALECFDRAIERNPSYAEAYGNRAAALGAMGRYPEALASSDRAISLAPEYAYAHSGRAAALVALGRYPEALASSERAISFSPEFANAHSNRGTALQRIGRLEEAVVAFQRALQLAPNFAEAGYNLGQAELALGRLPSGWSHCEHRWQVRANEAYRHAEIPRWSERNAAANKRVLLWCEQGLGDTIQFCRYAALVARLGAEVILEVQEPLKRLLSGLPGAAEVVALGDSLPACDLQIPLLSLPLVFDTTLDTIPASIPYLTVAASQVEAWRERLGRASGALRVGIACSGNPRHLIDQNRSIPLASFEPLFRFAEVVLLQKEIPPRDREALNRFSMTSFGDELTDFLDTAAVISNLDLVISVDTSLAHLAGALGKPVWILLAKNSDWRWLRGRDDSPWYPSARLFRQSALDDWAPVIQRMTPELERFQAHRPRS